MSSIRNPPGPRTGWALARPWALMCGFLMCCGFLGDRRAPPPSAQSHGQLSANTPGGHDVRHEGTALGAGGGTSREQKSPAPSQSLGPSDPSRVDGPAPPSVVWRFQTAAPISGAPAVSDTGFVYVSTVEGCIHSLGPDGVFRWIYGIDGSPLGAPALDRAGQVYVTTTAQRVYAIRPNGHLGWVHRSTVRIATAPVWGPPGVVYYGGRDQRLYALAAWGGPLWSRHLGHAVAGELAQLEDGGLAVGTTSPELWLFRGASLASRVDLPGVLTQPLLSGRDHWLVVVGEELLALDVKDRAVAWRTAARHAALSANLEWMLIERQRELVWLAPQTGDELHRVKLPGEPSATPALTNAGLALVPLVSGELLVLEPSGRLRARVGVASAPLWAPNWSERTQQATVAAGSGVVAGIDLRGWPKARARDGAGAGGGA